MKKINFAKWLRTERIESDMTQAQLASAAGMNIASIVRYESGKRIPNLVTTIKLADTMGSDLRTLVRYTYDVPN